MARFFVAFPVPVTLMMHAFWALSDPTIRMFQQALFARGFPTAAADSLARLASPDLRGFWVLLDVDVLNPIEMPAVDSPEPGGPMLDEIVDLLAPLVCHPRALGLELTIYDPKLDPDRSCAGRLVRLLETVLR
jgi:arginase